MEESEEDSTGVAGIERNAHGKLLFGEVLDGVLCGLDTITISSLDL